MILSSGYPRTPSPQGLSSNLFVLPCHSKWDLRTSRWRSKLVERLGGYFKFEQGVLEVEVTLVAVGYNVQFLEF